MRPRFLSRDQKGREKRDREKRDGEKGGATLELAIIGPTFILFIVGVVDLGRILMHHLVLTQIAYEGVRVASTLPGLEMTQSTGLRSLYSAAAGPASYQPQAPQQQKLLHERVRMLFNIHRNEGDLQIVESQQKQTAYTTVYPFPSTGSDVRVEVCTNYDGLFPAFFQTIRICAEAVGPYLDS